MPKKIVLGLVAIVAIVALILFGGGYLIDPTIAIGTDQRLSSPPAALYRFLDSTEGLDRWWSSETMTVKKLSGPDSGAGLRVAFEAGGKQIETWEVKSSDPPKQIVYAVDFSGMFTVERTLTLAPDGDGTKVSWRELGKLDNPLMRWGKVLSTPDSIINNFNSALAALDKVAATSTTSTTAEPGR